MAYSAISNSEIDTDSPINEGLLTKLRDNPEAMFAGMAGAPRLQPGAVTSATAGETVVYVFLRGASEVVPHNTSAWNWYGVPAVIHTAGVYRMYLDLRDGSSGAVYARIYVNGVQVGATITQEGGSWTTHYADLTLAAGDVVELSCNDGSLDGEVRDVYLACSVLPIIMPCGGL